MNYKENEHIQRLYEFRSLYMNIRIISVIALMVTLSGCNPHASLNQSNLDKVKEGMSSGEVKAVLGVPNETKSEPIPIVGGTKTTLNYNSGDNSITIVLKNDTVQTKEGHFDSKQ